MQLLSLTIVEAPAVDLLRQMGEDRHSRAFREMVDDYFGAFYAGDRAAIGAMIDFYGGAGTFAAWPQRVRGYAIETTATNILDWATAYGFPLVPAALARLGVPTLVLWGGASHPAVQRANELLGQCIPNAATVSLAGAAHFMIATHAAEVAGVIAEQVARTDYLQAYGRAPDGHDSRAEPSEVAARWARGHQQTDPMRDGSWLQRLARGVSRWLSRPLARRSLADRLFP